MNHFLCEKIWLWTKIILHKMLLWKKVIGVNLISEKNIFKKKWILLKFKEQCITWRVKKVFDIVYISSARNYFLHETIWLCVKKKKIRLHKTIWKSNWYWEKKCNAWYITIWKLYLYSVHLMSNIFLVGWEPDCQKIWLHMHLKKLTLDQKKSDYVTCISCLNKITIKATLVS